MILQVGVKALIQNSAGQYLFLQRSQAMDSEDEPSWDIPGGRINPHESLEDALAREIVEETGLHTQTTPTLIAAQDIFVTTKDLHVVRLTYTVACKESSIKLSHEHTEYRWVSLDEAHTLNLEPYLKSVVTQLVQSH